MKNEKKVIRGMQFKITLNDSKPKVWRRIVVPSVYSFFDLHCAIKNAMGWSDCHLHGFYIAPKGTSGLIMIKFPDPDNDYGYFDNDDLDERKEKIADYFGKRIKQCQYTYDFGDSWDHTILFEREYVAAIRAKYPICLAGENACPIEDSGGTDGYEGLTKILKNPKHKEYDEMCEWLGIESGEEIDPTELVVSDVYFENPRQCQKNWEKGCRI
ncbi:MAG: plasmid pRiA4b ORF-3 family protein [Candidatus Berkelbacteria bacterium]|nr:plasmid pRiA4b ORF-3 family protein [Candidatus Berkelbacteria bacterium]